MFAFIELPKILDQFMQSAIGTPHADPAYNPERIEMFYDVYAIRLIGYICLGVILLLIIIGFTTKRTGLAWLGGIALFLPVFATFAHSMFYLAGLGLLNIIIFPFQDISLTMVDLGKVVLIPYWILMWVFDLFGRYGHKFLAYFFMGLGAFLFVYSVFIWIQTRYSGLKVAKNWIYKYSRHPQYLGWIVWSYGLMLYGPSLNQMKKSWGWYGTLPWLLSTLVIIGICMLEEVKMKERAGKDYEDYRNRTPFLFPVPGFIKWIFAAPVRLFFGKTRPEKKREIGIILTFYGFLFMALSLFWVDLNPQQSESAFVQQPYNKARADSLCSAIVQEQPRRYRSLQPFNELLSMGEQTHPVFIELIKYPDIDVRDFAIIAARENKVTDAIPALIDALDDPEFRVINSAIHSLGEMGAVQAKDTLYYLLTHPVEGVRRNLLFSALTNLGCKRLVPFLEESLKDSIWYHYTGALRNYIKVDYEMAKVHLYNSLEDSRHEVRREAVYMILDSLPHDAIPHLEKVIHDEHWEIRFYAKQAIRLIEEKYEIEVR
jgi:protein-S-isoprenylcysteine O-methyltransferase Ste14